MSLLQVKDLSKNFGGLAAVSNVSMTVGTNELIGLIGPNGAGKTTFFNLVTGVYAPSQGSVELKDSNDQWMSIGGKSPHTINQLGIARTFQNIRLFKQMTVAQNVMVAMHGEDSNSLVSSLLRLPSFYRNEEQMYQKALQLLAIFDLDQVADDLAGNLAYGEQRRLEIVRALATNPKVLFLDEPAAGMNPNETAELTQLIVQIQEQFDLSIVLIEHDMSLVMQICQSLYVLEYGRLIAHGTPEEIRQNPAVIRAYLGGDA